MVTSADTKIFFVCGTTWLHEMGETGVMLFKSPEDLGQCAEDCGVVRLEVIGSFEEPLLQKQPNNDRIEGKS